MEKIYDVVILGAGAAGLSAAIYSARYRLKTLVLVKEIGGMANYAERLENYPGFVGSGAELMKKFLEQAKTSGAEILLREVVDVNKTQGGFEIKTIKDEKFYAKVLIIAMGTEKKKLNVKGEDEFLGKGVSYCATCDAPLFRGKKVAVIGGNDSAAHAALLLARYASKVSIIYRKNELRCKPFLFEQLKKEKIEIINEAIPVEIKGNSAVNEIVIEQKERKKSLDVDGVFIEIGNLPVSSIAKKLSVKLDKEGYIIVNEEMKAVEGIYAAGDITSGGLKQIVVAASQGAIAAASCYKFLKEK